VTKKVVEGFVVGLVCLRGIAEVQGISKCGQYKEVQRMMSSVEEHFPHEGSL